jgi:RNA polymerase sigma factor (sigma-70 family)
MMADGWPPFDSSSTPKSLMPSLNAELPRANTHEAAHVSDHSLLRRFKLGQDDAATGLYLRYAQRLLALARSKSSLALARRVEAEEIVQSVFGSFFRGAQQGYYDVPAGDELWKLFLVITLNKIRAKGAFHGAAKRDMRKTIEFDEAFSTAKSDSDALRLLTLTLNESLDNLPEHYREIVNLRVEGYEVDEIARRTERSKRTVERILQEARKRLSHLLDEDT